MTLWLVIVFVVLNLGIGAALILRRLPSEPSRPKRLYRRMLRRMGFAERERALLRRIAADLRLEHPAILLLSPELFRAHARKWQQHEGTSRAIPESELVTIGERLECQSSR